jgi:hypothetical protein
MNNLYVLDVRGGRWLLISILLGICLIAAAYRLLPR